MELRTFSSVSKYGSPCKQTKKNIFLLNVSINIHTQYERNTQTFSCLLSVLLKICENASTKWQCGSAAGCLLAGLQRRWGGENWARGKYPVWKHGLAQCSEQGGEVSKICVVTCNWWAASHQPICTVQAPDYISSLSSPLSFGMWIMGLDKMIKISLVSWFQLVV